MKLVNLTGHDLGITDGRVVVKLPPVGKARIVNEPTDAGSVVVTGLSKPLHITELREDRVVDLPDPEPDTLFIVSGIVAAHVPDRPDVVAPGQLVRDKKTRETIGCQGFVKPMPKVA